MRTNAVDLSSSSRWLVASAMLMALLVGLFGGVFGLEGQLAIVLFAVPALALLADQRLGLILFILLIPYNGAVDVPRLAQNIIFFGIGALFVMRLLVNRMVAGSFQLPLPRELILYALVFTAATAIGVTHLHEITPAYLAVMEVSQGYGFKEYVVGVYARQFMLLLMAATIVWLLVARGCKPDWIINVALASGVLFVTLMLAVVAARGFPLAELSSREFFMVLGRHSNSLAAMLLILLCSSLYMWQVSENWVRRLALAGITLALMAGVVMSASRGAILTMLLVFVWFIVEFRRVRVLFFGALFLALAAAFAPDSVRERMFRGLDDRAGVTLDASQGFDDQLTSGRIYIWSRLAPEVAEHPFFGGGLASTQWSEFARSAEFFATHPHNLYLSMLMDTGVVGSIIVMMWFLYLWRLLRSLGSDRRLAPHLRGYFRGASVAVMAYLFYGSVNGVWFPTHDQAFMWVAAGLAIGMRAVLPPVETPAPVKVKPTLQGRIARPWRPTPRT